MIADLKEVAAFNDLGVRVIIWGDEIVADKTIGKSGTSTLAIGMCLGMCFGMMLGQLLFDNVALGMCVGMGFGTQFDVECFLLSHSHQTFA